MQLTAHLAALIAVVSTAVIYGTDAFCALVQRPALARVDDATLTAVMGNTGWLRQMEEACGERGVRIFLPIPRKQSVMLMPMAGQDYAPVAEAIAEVMRRQSARLGRSMKGSSRAFSHNCSGS